MVLTTKKDDKWFTYTLLNGAFYDGFFLKGDGAFVRYTELVKHLFTRLTVLGPGVNGVNLHGVTFKFTVQDHYGHWRAVQSTLFF